MSELIANQKKRQEILKRVIRRLHEGSTVEEVKDEFAQLLQDVGASEIAALEQALINEGLPESEVKRLCDVHVAVFRESLEEQVRPETLPGHPVHTFLAENRAMGGVLEALGQAIAAFRKAPGPDQLEHLRAQLAELRRYEKHYLRKEHLLFPYLEKKGFAGPSKVMWAIHDDVRMGWRALEELLTAGPGDEPDEFIANVETVFRALDKTVRDMFFKEERILYPTSLEMLSEAEWAAIREQEGEIGYAYIEPGTAWVPGAAAAAPAAPVAPPIPPEEAAAPAGALPLQTGKLTLEQINLLLNHLPVDVTFVDENDTVRFFSERGRIFPRTPAVIGRRVQLCHPPTSVHRVQRILDDLRSGRRDEAEFWIQQRGRFIHIRYFAVRDQEDNYRGTLEVTQDITEIRTLQGERRLLDEG